MQPDTPSVRKNIGIRLALLGLITCLFCWWNLTLLPWAYGFLLLCTARYPSRRNVYRSWVRWVGCSLACGLALVAFFNYLIDPLWCFDHCNRWNRAQVGFNERLQKTNLVTFRGFNYRSLLIGSSRVAVLNQSDFKNMAVFNYAAATMVPDEYGDYIRFARNRKGKDFRTILLGMDFFGTNANYKKRFDSPEQYVSAATSFLYRYKMLLTYDTLRYAKNNVVAGEGKEVRGTYDRCNVRTPKIHTREARENLVREQFLWYGVLGYGQDYCYDESLKEKLRKLKEENPGSHFIVFTTPVSRPLFCLMVKKNRLPDYERWLRDLVEVFGGFYNFMDLNTVTRDYLRTFSDCDHLYPEEGRLIAHRVLGVPDASLPPDFGKLVTKDTIEETIASIREQCAACR